MDEETVTLAELIDHFDLDPEYAERELEHVRNMYRGEVDLREIWGTFTEQKRRYTSIGKTAARLSSLLLAEKEQFPFSDLAFADVPEPDCTMDQLLAVLQRVQRYTETASDRQPIKGSRNDPDRRDYLLYLLRDAWENLTGKPANVSTKAGSFEEFIDLSCEFMGLDPKGLWKRHRG